MRRAIILGAGPAGLTAAYELLTRTDIVPVIVDLDKQVGGLSKTVNYKGNLMDIGGHRFFSKSQKIVDWWLRFLPLENTAGDQALRLQYQNQSVSLFDAREKNVAGNGRMLIRPRKSRIFYNGSFFDYPLQLNARTIRNFGAGKIMRMAASYLRANLFPVKDERTLADFFTNRFGRELYLTFFKGYTEKIWGVPCEDIPASWGQQRVKDLNIARVIAQSVRSIFRTNKSITQRGVSTSLIEQFLYPQRGPGQMWEAVAEEIGSMGGSIHLNTRVDQVLIAADGNIKSVHCKQDNGETLVLTGDYFFSTIPVRQLIKQFKNTSVPSDVLQTAGSLAYRDFIIVGLLVRKSPPDGSENLDTLTDNWIYLQDARLQAGRLQLFHNWSPFMVADPNTHWIGVEYFCNETDAIWSLSDEAMAALAIREMASTGLLKKENILDSTVVRVPKAYPSYVGGFRDFDTVRNYLDKFPNLFLIGRNGMHRYNNTDHSMMTAMTAVDNIVEGKTGRENIWAVNMEQDYHEEK